MTFREAVTNLDRPVKWLGPDWVLVYDRKTPRVLIGVVDGLLQFVDLDRRKLDA